ncbi:MAG: PEP-CTERM sorting domain-containing protein [Pseudomonadota bacterium]
MFKKMLIALVACLSLAVWAGVSKAACIDFEDITFEDPYKLPTEYKGFVWQAWPTSGSSVQLITCCNILGLQWAMGNYAALSPAPVTTIDALNGQAFDLKSIYLAGGSASTSVTVVGTGSGHEYQVDLAPNISTSQFTFDGWNGIQKIEFRTKDPKGLIVLDNFEYEPAAQTPLPASLLLMGSGVLSFFGVRRKTS